MTTEPIVLNTLGKLHIGPGIVLILPLVYFIFYLSLSVSLVSHKFPHLYSTHTLRTFMDAVNLVYRQPTL